MRSLRHLSAVLITVGALTACGTDAVPSTVPPTPAVVATGGVGGSPDASATAAATSAVAATPCTTHSQPKAGMDDFCDQVTLNPAAADGLQFGDFTVGTGASPASGQNVTVQYTGWLQADGTKFDSSRDHGQPFSFPIGQGQVIKGWDEGVATMKVGGKRRLVIPAALGYGASGSPPTIPGGATLVFDVELLSVG